MPEPSSAMISSQSVKLCANTDSIAGGTNSSRLNVGIRIETAGVTVISADPGHSPEHCRTLQESVIGPAAGDFSVFEFEDDVARSHRGHPVCDENSRVPASQSGKRGHEFPLRQTVEGIRGLVQ